MKNKKNKLIVIIFLLVSIIYTLLVKYVDVASIGPKMSNVGFSTINKFVRDFVGYSDLWYKVTKYLGILPFLLVGFYGVEGLLQLIKYKSISKVDKRLLYLACLYVLLGITYIFFEKVIINYRPILMDGELEASYPSSHTMLAVTICLSSLLVNKYYIKDKAKLKILQIMTLILMFLLVFGRLLSGVHWFSDIIGGVIISTTLVSIYYYFISGKR